MVLYKGKARDEHITGLCSNYSRQRPTLPHTCACSTIGGIRLNFRVRNGNGCDPDPMTTGKLAAWGPSFARMRGLRRGVPHNLFKKPRPSDLVLRLTSEYSANGSFARPHPRSGFCVHVV